MILFLDPNYPLTDPDKIRIKVFARL
ncbi:unnamed protein product, partial [Rotaria sordida]